MKKLDIEKIDAHIIASLRDQIRLMAELISSKNSLIELLSTEVNDLKKKNEDQNFAEIHAFPISSARKNKP